MASDKTPTDSSSPGSAPGSGEDKSSPQVSSTKPAATGFVPSPEEWWAVTQAKNALRDSDKERGVSIGSQENDMMDLTQLMRRAGGSKGSPDGLGLHSKTTPVIDQAASSLGAA